MKKLKKGRYKGKVRIQYEADHPDIIDSEWCEIVINPPFITIEEGVEDLIYKCRISEDGRAFGLRAEDSSELQLRLVDDSSMEGNILTVYQGAKYTGRVQIEILDKG